LRNLAKIVVLVVLLLAVVFLALPTTADETAGSRNCLFALAAPEEPPHTPYDPATVEMFTGEVTEVLLREGRMNATALHLILAVGEEAREVAVGPTFYLFPEGLDVVKGDTVTVTGSLVTKTAGGTMLLARHIVVGDFELALRDEAGIPAWRGLNPGGPGKATAAGTGKGMGESEGQGMGRAEGMGHGCRHGEGMSCAEHCAAMKSRHEGQSR
jgi:hypothetical protein